LAKGDGDFVVSDTPQARAERERVAAAKREDNKRKRIAYWRGEITTAYCRERDNFDFADPLNAVIERLIRHSMGLESIEDEFMEGS
jgi:hypothetical protein